MRSRLRPARQFAAWWALAGEAAGTLKWARSTIRGRFIFGLIIAMSLMLNFACSSIRRSIALAVVGLAAWLAIAGPSAAEDKLQARVDALLAEPHFKHAHWGMLFVDLQTGDVVLER